jgi:Fe-S cluster assembly scaffold protein SufB
MLDLRLKSLRLFDKKPMPTWGSDLSGIDFQNIKYFVKSTEKQATSWEDLPEDIKNTYDRLGIPEAEKQRLIAGVAAQYEARSSTTRSARTWRRRASSSSTPTPACASTGTSSASTSAR